MNLKVLGEKKIQYFFTSSIEPNRIQLLFKNSKGQQPVKVTITQ